MAQRTVFGHRSSCFRYDNKCHCSSTQHFQLAPEEEEEDTENLEGSYYSHAAGSPQSAGQTSFTNDCGPGSNHLHLHQHVHHHYPPSRLPQKSDIRTESIPPAGEEPSLTTQMSPAQVWAQYNCSSGNGNSRNSNNNRSNNNSNSERSYSCPQNPTEGQIYYNDLSLHPSAPSHVSSSGSLQGFPAPVTENRVVPWDTGTGGASDDTSGESGDVTGSSGAYDDSHQQQQHQQ